jgi:hypothetical protein
VGHGDDETPIVDDKASAAVDSEWRTAREIYAIIDQGASTVGALIRLADAGKIERTVISTET